MTEATESNLAASGADEPPLFKQMLPHLTVCFLAFLVAGVALPVLPLHVQDTLHLGGFTVGLITSAQFIASFVTRLWAGHYADTVSAKGAVIIGACLSGVSALIYALSLLFIATPVVSAGILLIGRAVLGAGGSFVFTGALTWALGIAGLARSGKVLSWLGVPIYFGMAVGAPIGSAIYAAGGFGGLSLVCFVIAIVAALSVLPGKDIAPSDNPAPTPTAILKLFGVVTWPALAVSLSTLGYAAVTIFITLLFSQRGWDYGWAALTLATISFLAARITFGPMPDKIGGAKAALISIGVQAVGLFTIWLAPNATFVFIGCALTGAGYSIVFPSFGLETVQMTAKHSNRGMVMGAYTGFSDLALAVGTTGLGAVASAAGTPAVFLVCGVAALGAMWVSLKLIALRRQASVAV